MSTVCQVCVERVDCVSRAQVGVKCVSSVCRVCLVCAECVSRVCGKCQVCAECVKFDDCL